MSRLAFTALTLFNMTYTGFASQYSAGVMAPTVKARVMMGHITQSQVRAADAYIAVLECKRLGETGWMSINGNAPQSYLVVDCARRDDGDGTRSWMKANNVVLELSGETAAFYGVTGKGNIRVTLWPVVKP